MPGLSPIGPTRVLVVNDEPSGRRALGQWLHDAGYMVALTHSAEARARLGEHDYAIIILGEDASRGVKSDLSGLAQQSSPLVAVLAASSDRIGPELIRFGAPLACSHIAEPMSSVDVLARVRAALRQRRIVVAVNQLVRRLLEDGASEEQVIGRLIRATTRRDGETGSHIERVGRFSGMLAERMGRDRPTVDAIRLAAPLHDIGKLCIPNNILRKPGPLAPREFFAMQAHTFLGWRMLAGVTSPVLKMAQEIAQWHHERWDGSGYPFGLAGPGIPESARIVGLVDVFDALTHDRVYRRALPQDDVLRVLRDGRGAHFDPGLLDCFLGLVPEIWPVPVAQATI